MLTHVLLSFVDKSMGRTYERERITFFKRSMPIVTLMAILLASSLEVLYRVLAFGEITLVTTIVNGSACLLLFVLSLLVCCKHCFTCLVNPLLTLFAFYFISEVDYDGVNISIYYSVVVGTAVSFFFLVFFSEIWIVSTVFYAPSVTYFMYKTGRDMLMAGKTHENYVELGMRSAFCILIYAVVAYKIELLTKQSFLGKESNEKTFYRWLRIFETFPEGLALIRNGQIIYANKSLTSHFEFPELDASSDPYHDKLKKLLSKREVVRLGGESPYSTSPWDFLSGTENGAPFSMTL